MNRGAVSVSRAYVRQRRVRGAAMAVQTARAAMRAGARFAVCRELIAAAVAADLAYEQLRGRHFARIRISEDTRLARANGWGSAGLCPAGHDAKKPAARTRVCRVAGGVAHTSLPACKTVPRPMVGVSDES